MSEFTQVTVVKEANVYFEGGVVSRTVCFEDGSTKTLGFMQPGEYTFNNSKKELMEIMSGELDVLLPETEQWQTIKTGGAFEVPAQSKFTVKVFVPTDYCCSFFS